MIAAVYIGAGGPDEPWRRETPMASGAARLHVQAWWNDPARARPLALEALDSPSSRRVEQQLDGSILLLQDLPPEFDGKVVLTCASRPDRVVVRATPRAAPGAATTGVLPRSLGPSRTASVRAPFEVDPVLEALEAGDLEGALAFAGELCVAGARAELAKLAPRVAAYAQAHALHRSDELGMFVAALSGVRGGE